MRITATYLAGLGLAILTALPATAGNLYPVHTSHNYCPAGLQPVTKDGSICCGKPTTDTTYQAMMAHPVRKHHTPRKAVADDCPIGEKGCR